MKDFLFNFVNFLQDRHEEDGQTKDDSVHEYDHLDSEEFDNYTPDEDDLYAEDINIFRKILNILHIK